MKKLVGIISILISFCTLNISAQTTIKMEELALHIGDSVKVATKIYGGKFLDQSQGTPTLLNAGGVYPNALLTLFIAADVRAKFSVAPEELFKNKDVIVTGKLILFKGKPEVVIYGVGQIEVLK